MTPKETRFAEIFSYYLDERRANDLSETFPQWLTTSMYGEELTTLCDGLCTEAYAGVQEGSTTEEWGCCQDCGEYIDEDSYYVTSSGDVFCEQCGRAADEADEAAEDEEGFDFYATYEDIVEGETGGRFIGEGSENGAPETDGSQ